jgi:branched-chain amino acid transport system permease protein
MGLQEYLSALITGAGIGSMYGLVALGYYTTYAVSRTVNFAQGSSLMLGAVLTFTLSTQWHWPVSLAVLLALVLCGLWGYFVEVIAVRPFVKRNSDAWLMATVALGLILENIVLFSFGKDPRGQSSPLLQIGFDLGGLHLNALQLLIPAAGFVIALILALGMRFTTLGKSLLAIAQNRIAARLMGIDSEKLIGIAFALSGIFAGIAGILIAPLYTVSAGMGTVFGIKAFAAAIVGGIESAAGVMMGGLLLGITEALLVTALGSTYAQMFSFGLTIVVLCMRPAGLFGKRGVNKV